jgi:EAL and modified HD-GYP domain-containing signal transduction protein
VETQSEFKWAQENGFSLFQGYFFAKPRISSIAEVAGFKPNFIQLLNQLSDPNFNFDQVAMLVERDPSLSYKLLRLGNSALFARGEPASSVRQVILRIGEEQTRKWLSVILILDLSSERPSEVMVSALIRARLCELLGSETGLQGRAQELFLLGLFSRLDSLFPRSLTELLEDINLREDIRSTLLETAPSATHLSQTWATVRAYEAGDWDKVSRLLPIIKVAPDRAYSIYTEAVAWADRMLHREQN